MLASADMSKGWMQDQQHWNFGARGDRTPQPPGSYGLLDVVTEFNYGLLSRVNELAFRIV